MDFRPRGTVLCAVMAAVVLMFLPSILTCTVDNGEFIQVLQLKEEQPVGFLIGTLNLDAPSKVAKLSVSESNPYIDLVLRNGSTMAADFVVSKLIDVDEGLNRLQTMYLDCTTNQGLRLEIELEFEIEDINDHSPKFLPSPQYNFSISERAVAGTQVGTIIAKDGDIKNAYVEYEILADQLFDKTFEIRRLPNGGMAIYTITSLDYETHKVYSFRVKAKDCQLRRSCEDRQRTSVASVTVNILNEDDLSPKFNQHDYRVSLSQDAQKGDLVVQVTAYDQDDFNEPIEYFLFGDGSEYFYMDKVTGKVTVQNEAKLDSGTTFLLQVQARQTSDPKMKDVTTLVISVVSANWNKPQFTKRSYATSISEYSKVNSTILSMALNYNLQKDPLVVQVVNSEGDKSETAYFKTVHTGNNVDLVQIAPLDYEEERTHHVRVVASNGKHSDAVEVTVHILNENDNNPVFDQPSYSFSAAYEEQGIVGTVSASDKDDSSDSILYKILQSDVSDLFSINQDGVVALAAKEDMYTKDSYTLIAEAADAGVPPRTTNVVITINYQFMDIGAESVRASDSSSNSMITYAIIGAAVTVVLIVAIGVACFLYQRKISMRNQRKRQAEEDRRKEAEESVFTPLNRDQHCKSSLGLSSVINGRHENTYRDMSELNHDENYRLLWGSDTHSTTDTADIATLTSPQGPQATPSSDSGRSSCSNHHSQSDCEANATTASIGECTVSAPGSPRRGYISNYLQEQKKRQNSNFSEKGEGQGSLPAELDSSFPPPPAFRTPNSSRPASVSGSTYSDYAASNTSDYGSNTVSSETHYNSRMGEVINNNKVGSQSHMQSSMQSNEEPTNVIVISSHPTVKVIAANHLNDVNKKKPFSTFHGDVV